MNLPYGCTERDISDAAGAGYVACEICGHHYPDYHLYNDDRTDGPTCGPCLCDLDGEEDSDVR